MPRGGVQTSLVSLIDNLTAPFRRQSGARSAPFAGPNGAQAKGAPILSYSFGQNGGGYGVTPDITRFAPVFQPSGGLFAPGYPLVPVEREQTRRFNFPVGVNYIYTPRSFEPISFAELKALSRHDITRLCIETRKDQIEKLDWTIKSRNEKKPGRNAESRIQKVTEFFEYPDGERPFATWLRELIDEVLVADAPALEPRRNRGGDLIALDIIEGSTIKVLIDDTGRRPRPPAPAFQQIIHGRPWVMMQDGTRANTDEGEIVDEFTDQELIYFPRNQRTDHLYGFSPVEQIVLTINTGIRRAVMQLQHFTEGNVPPGLVNAPTGWTPEQIAQFQDWFDSKLAGNTAERAKLLWGPEGAKYQAIKEAPYKDDFDEWLSRIICFAFSLPPTAFTKQVNRNTAETAQEAALEEGLAPIMGWVKRLIDGVIQRRMGHPDLEFAWSDAQPIDPTDQAVMLVNLTGNGLMTLNEGRDQLGFDPVEGGDEILFKTASGPVTLDSVLNPPEPPPMLAPNGTPGQNGQNGPTEQGKPGAKNPPPSKPGEKPPAEQGKQPPGKGKPGAKPAGKPKKEVGKAADSPFGKRMRSPGRNTALLEATRTRLQAKLEHFFAERAKEVAAQLAREMRLEGWESLGKLAKYNENHDEHGLFASGDGAPAAIDRVDHGILPDKAQQKAFEAYTGAGGPHNSDQINGYLRGQSEGTPAVKADVAAIQQAFTNPDCRLNQATLLFRGSSSGWKEMSSQKVGATVEMKGFVSTSTSAAIASEFRTNKDGFSMQIGTGKGTPAISPSKAFTGEDFGAQEILLNTGSKYQITGFDRKAQKVMMRAL